MPRTYGTSNHAPYATAPAVGLAGDTYYNTTSKIVYVSDGTAWIATSGSGAPDTALRERAWQTAAQNIPNSTDTVIALDAQTAGGHFDLVNDRWVCPVAGWYAIWGACSITSIQSNTRFYISMRVNGVEVTRGNDNVGALSVTIYDVRQLAVNDYVQLTFFQATGSTQPTQNLPFVTYFGIEQQAFATTGPTGPQGPVGPSLGPAWLYDKAQPSVNQTITASTFTKMTLASATGTNFNIANSRWVCPATGYYNVVARAAVLMGANARFFLTLYVNGAEYARGSDFSCDASGAGGGLVTETIYMTAGQYVETWCYANPGGTLVGNSGPQITSMTVYSVSTGVGPPLGILGTVASVTSLPAASGVASGNGYITADTGHLWLSSGGAWVDAGAMYTTPISVVTALPGTLQAGTLYVVVT